MNRVIQTDIASVITEWTASAFTSLTAGGTGDNTSVVGLTLDRASVGVPLCGEIVIAFEAVLAAAATLSVTALKIEHSADASTWADYLALTAPGVVATGPGGGGTVRGQATAAVNLSSAYRYIRVTHTPDLSAANTDTAKTLALLVLAGFAAIPAPL
jgi:hypothetical protein